MPSWGRISPEKRPDRAIEIAKRAGAKLKMAAKIDRVDEAYWNEVIKPMVAAAPNVEFVGEINEREKADFLGNAAALLFPIDWPEPFGLVMIEAMACGTPVIAFRRGSAPEVIDDGVTGFLVDDVSAAVAAVARLEDLNWARTRAVFERRFAIERVATDYLSIYRNLPGSRIGRHRALQSDELGLGLVAAANLVDEPIRLKPGRMNGVVASRLGSLELMKAAPDD